jgi:hypothetical protein
LCRCPVVNLGLPNPTEIARMSMISIMPYNDYEDGRIERLEAVSAELIEKKLPILAIHDHKGTLYVNWSKKPRTSQVVEVMDIWAKHAEYMANHYFNGAPFILDVFGDNPFGPVDSAY